MERSSCWADIALSPHIMGAVVVLSYWFHATSSVSCVHISLCMLASYHIVVGVVATTPSIGHLTSTSSTTSNGHIRICRSTSPSPIIAMGTHRCRRLHHGGVPIIADCATTRHYPMQHSTQFFLIRHPSNQLFYHSLHNKAVLRGLISRRGIFLFCIIFF